MRIADVVIAGGGVAGLALALALRSRGRDVVLLERGLPGAGASSAAAGMLAAHDPAHPALLQPLADLSLRLYPDFLANVRRLSGHPVPVQTSHVLEADTDGEPATRVLHQLAPGAGRFRMHPEESLDPRDLVRALPLAAQAVGASVQTGAAVVTCTATALGVLLHTSGESIMARQYVDCTGAWSQPFATPAKGQMLRVKMPPDALRLADGSNAVVRTPDIYIVPRLDGTAVIGATVEDVGFDIELHDPAIAGLRERAASLLPSIAKAEEVERWAGLRPRTADDLPVLGQVEPSHFVATGLFRNGVLLAPAVAHVVAQLVCGEPPEISLDAFAPHRASLFHLR